ncbi:MAG: 16S rRNA (cytosine(1402)-N(4))-methyltransferase RsmH [Nitrospirota bacterium]
MASRHVPVLAEEVVQWLEPVPGSVLFDGTLGGGGHARALLNRAQGRGRLLAVDRDRDAWARSGLARAFPEAELRFVHATFQEVLARLVDGREPGRPFDCMLLDFGLSSDQLDDPQRGFSFHIDGPLDMRMDRSRGETASIWLDRQDENSLAQALRDYGEVPRPRTVARRILAARPIETTRDLARVCADVLGSGDRGHHPATLVFQAVRIAVNNELSGLQHALEHAVACLAPAGRLAVIAFHSLEDRIVKTTFRRQANPCICPPTLPKCVCGRLPVVQLLTRRPVVASAREVAANPRARSARLRVVTRLPVPS